ncbi:tRNA lysidine(34) synthetase TilS [Riemerella columbipharyngis]|uniref:tRNA(Ile)-lysidine synthase n=1 Tax=Riemerella columbipharyngis TaxID=1071918 RepID=A0A1G7B948_9FLAO|nr:tRNA lysidine(34) synthetase TilS [Riemerella columbipharyngis]SDE22836.1 tRNA(Ile)-lysidine synthase [Riemerella columbipharyngis]
MLNIHNFSSELSALVEQFSSHTYLLGVSGGVDSMVLCHLFLSKGIDFQISHINYKLRGKDSDLDKKTVEDFCVKNKIKLHIYEVSEKDNKPAEGSIQLWARELRYKIFQKIMREKNLDFLATAHHLDDNLETFIINLSRGAGVKGLSGIPKCDNNIVRPLLGFTKKEIYAYAKNQKVPYREDLSNTKNDYLRNEIRNLIIPKLLETNGAFMSNFKKSISILNDTQHYLSEKIGQDLENITLKKNDSELTLDKNKLQQLSPFTQYEILRRFGFNDAKEIAKIFDANTGSVFYTSEHQLIINRNELIIISPKEKKEDLQEISLPKKKEIDLSQWIGNDFETKKMVWKLDANLVTFPLKLRLKKEGDIFYPMGMQGKKKVSKYLKDEKLSILMKQKIRLLCDAKDRILGIVPLRQDARFASKSNDNEVIIILKKSKNQ